MSNNIELIYALTPMQEGMLFHNYADGESSEYFLQNTITITGELKLSFVKSSLNLLSKKYDVLRTAFVSPKTSKQPLQVVLLEREIELSEINLLGENFSTQVEKIEILKQKDLERGFLLDKDSLLRVTIIRISNDKSIVLWSAHHIIIDGWCNSILLRDFMTYYELLYQGENYEQLLTKVLEEKTFIPRYKDYIEIIKKKDVNESLSYWKNFLADYNEVAEIKPIIFTEEEKKHVDTEIYLIKRTITDQIRTLAADINVTISTVLETAWGILLQKYNNKRDVVFGKVVSGRNVDIQGIEQAIGLFINTIPTRVRCEEKMNGVDLLQQVQNQAYESMPFEFCQLADIQNLTTLGNSLIQSLYVFENYFVDENAKEINTSIKIEAIESREQTNYPITLTAYYSDDLKLDIMYDPNQYSKYDISFLLKRLEIILEQLTNKECNIDDIIMIDNEEQNLILNEFNNTKADLVKNRTVIELFELQVKRTPNSPAVTYLNQSISYLELNERANSLAYKLKDFGVGREDFVVIISERSIEMIVGIYAILKAGGAYVPINPSYPTKRIEYIISDCKPKVVLLGDKAYLEPIDSQDFILLSDSCCFDKVPENPEHVNDSKDLVYLIYTSGTTGQPKGVMNCHEGLINRILWMNGRYPIKEGDVILQKTTFTFDVSVWEIFWWSFVGAKVVMLKPGGEKEPDTIAQVIKSEHVTVMHFVPSMLDIFLSYLATSPDSRDNISTLKYIFSSGEALKTNTLKNFNHFIRSKFYHTRLINFYGPTEASIDVTYFDCEYDERRIPIGKPIANTGIYIMDQNNLCGIGVPGELCIAGIGLARGYLNKPELTNEKFVTNPFGEGKLYKAGDLARWLPDGNIEYLGRIDEQVKIRGFRIELGEIESVLNKIPYITGAIVAVKSNSDGDKCLCAYVTSNTKVSTDEIRELISHELVEYMIPTYIVQINEIPVTLNGKLDKKALPDIELKSSKEYIAPKTDKEILLVRLYEEILSTKPIGLMDNFFELGGHSLKATRLMTRIEAETGIRIPLKDLFSYSTPQKLAACLEEKELKEYERIPKVEKKEYYQASSAQKRLYVINELNSNSTAYNMPVGIKVKGLLDSNKVEEVIKVLTIRHEAFRTSFHSIHSAVYQKIHDDINYDFTFETLEEDNDEKINLLLESFIKPFDLSKAPLMRVKFINLNQKESVLFFDMHHIISDGASMNLVISEFTKLYNDQSLDDIKLQYKDYSEWMHQRDMSEQKNFWLNRFHDEIPTLDLPYDYKRPQIQSFNGDRIIEKINLELKDEIKRVSNLLGVTEYMIYLAALMILMGKTSNQEDIIIGSPISGRVHKDTEQIMGIFINTLAMRGKPNGKKSFHEFLQEMKEMLLQSYENQEYAFEDFIEELNIRRDVSRNPLFDVLFTMENIEPINAKLNGLDYRKMEFQNNVAKLDLSITLSEDTDGYVIEFEYCTDLFKKESIKRMLHHYKNILLQVSKQWTLNIENIDMLDEEERDEVLNVFNETKFEWNNNLTKKPIMEQFEQQVEKTPNNNAITYCGRSLTYRELNNRANYLANLLSDYKIQADDFIAFIAKRSLEMMVGIYGILKAGAAYVPIEVNYPLERIRYILSDCNPRLVLISDEDTKNQVIDLLDDLELPFIILENLQYEGEIPNQKLIRRNQQDLLYAIYTSGTTGRPKGVMIEEGGVRNLCDQLYQNIYAEYTKPQQVILLASYCFDASVQQIFTPLLFGHCLHITSDDVRFSGDLLVDYICENNIKIMDGTPNHLKLLTEAKKQSDWCIEKCIIGGEELPSKVLELIYINHKDLKIFNVYGPTEATVDSTIYECNYKDITSKKISIGHPLDHVKIYILQGNTLCGIGVPGELCIAGVGLARGYVNNRNATELKFVKNPFADGRMYRSGDLALWKSDGNLEYIGRCDNQVKVRGYRVELGEIENLLRELEEVIDAVAIIAEDIMGEKQIYAYIVSETNQDMRDLKNKLGSKLPYYMIPSGIMQIEEIPLTLNGKIDYDKLPKIEIQKDSNYVIPSTDEEKILVSSFEEVLGITNIGIKDNFYDMGGDSIKAIRAISRIRDKGYELSIRDIMELPVIENLASRLYKNEKTFDYNQNEIYGDCPLTPIQREFLGRKLCSPNHFNQSIILKSMSYLDLEAIQNSLKEIVRHHDILRAVFIQNKQTIIKIEESSLIEFHVHDLSEITDSHCLSRYIEAENNKIQRSMDITSGPLVKTALYRTLTEDHLFICIHHLVIDGVSWRILLEELQMGYNQFKNQKKIELPKKTASYKQWSEHLIQQKNSIDKGEIEYWTNIIKNLANRNRKKTDIKIPNVFSKKVFELDEIITSKLQYDSNQAFHTYFDELLLVALLYSSAQLFHRNEISIQLEGHGRQLSNQELIIDRTIGWFTSTYPVILEMKKDITETIIHLKEMLRRVPNKGFGYQLVKDIINQDNYEITEDLCFNYLGDMDAEILNSGLLVFSDFSTGEDNAKENEIQRNIEINCFIKNRKLNFNITYRKHVFTEAEIDNFINNYKITIEEIIDLCTNQEESIVTVSDFGAFDMSKDEISFLNEILDL